MPPPSKSSSHLGPEQIVNVPRENFAPVESWDNSRPINKDYCTSTLAPSFESIGMLHPPRGLVADGLVKPVTGRHRCYTGLFVLNWSAMPMILISGKPTEFQLLIWGWDENQHLNMSPVQEMSAAFAIQEAGKLNGVQLAKAINRPACWVSAKEGWRINLTPEQLADIDAGRVGPSIADWIASCRDKQVRDELWSQNVAKKLNKEQTKRAVQKANGGARKYTRASSKLVLTHKNGIKLPLDTTLPFDEVKAAVNHFARRLNDATGFDDLRTEVSR